MAVLRNLSKSPPDYFYHQCRGNGILLEEPQSCRSVPATNILNDAPQASWNLPSREHTEIQNNYSRHHYCRCPPSKPLQMEKCVCVRVCLHISICVYIYIWTVCILCINMYRCRYVCMYVCIYMQPHSLADDASSFTYVLARALNPEP